MDKQDVIKMATYFVENSEYNLIPKEIALSDTVVGMKIFETPIFAFGAADDEYFRILKEPSVTPDKREYKNIYEYCKACLDKRGHYILT